MQNLVMHYAITIDDISMPNNVSVIHAYISSLNYNFSVKRHATEYHEKWWIVIKEPHVVQGV